MAVNFLSFADIFKHFAMRAEPVHLAESAAPSGSSRLYYN